MNKKPLFFRYLKENNLYFAWFSYLHLKGKDIGQLLDENSFEYWITKSIDWHQCKKHYNISTSILLAQLLWINGCKKWLDSDFSTDFIIKGR